MKEWTGYAESVEEALTRGLKKLGLTRDEVQLDILSESNSTLFSMMDYHRVKVRLTEKPGARPAPARDQRLDDKRRGRESRPPLGAVPDSRTGRPPFRGDRDKGSRERHGRDPGRIESQREQQSPRKGERRRNNRPVEFRDRRNENQDRRQNDPSFQQKNRQNRFPENRRPVPQQQRPNRPVPPIRLPVSAPESAPHVPDTQGDILPPVENILQPPTESFQAPPINRSEQIQITPKEDIPMDAASSQSSTPIRREESKPFDATNLETHLFRWKELLAWEDLSWSIKASEGHRLSVQLSTLNQARLMGQNGETLEAFEYLFNLVLTQSNRDAPPVQFGMEGFEPPRVQRIIDLAKRAAAEARRSRSVYRMDPMPGADRRIVHQTLANEPDLETVSEGEGPFRKVVIRLKGGGGAPPPKNPSPWKR